MSAKVSGVDVLSTLQMEAISSSETLAYKTTRRHNPQDHNQHFHSRYNLKYHICFAGYLIELHKMLWAQWTNQTDYGVNRRRILKLMLHNKGVKVCIGFIWIRIGSSGGLLRTWWWTMKLHGLFCSCVTTNLSEKTMLVDVIMKLAYLLSLDSLRHFQRLYDQTWTGLRLAQPGGPAATVSVLNILPEDGRRSSFRNVVILLKYRRWTKSKNHFYRW
jgi:hypothetical protein